MFDSLTSRLSGAFKKITGQGKLSEKNITKALKDVRNALLEADVALPVIKEFIAKVRRRALGQEVGKSLNPTQALIKIVQSELQGIMGESCDELDLSAQPPAVILMAGLQGSGKTTTCAKLAKRLKEQLKKKVLVASADVYRPAAIDQLHTLAQEVGVDFFESNAKQKPLDIAKKALAQAKKSMADVLIIDTAGRLSIDQDMMDEIIAIHQTIDPVETLYIADSMTGQDAVNTAKTFHNALALTGVILTKTDGDARGGAALSIRHAISVPIKFLGAGEKIDALEAFHPDRIASRILGMGDVTSLIEEIEQKTDQEAAKKLTQKIKKGQKFNLIDFQEQLKQIDKLGNMKDLISKIPGTGQIPEHLQSKLNDNKMTVKTNAILNSMTLKEKQDPEVIKGSRKRRIAQGSGTEVQDVNRLLKQFDQMQKMMKKMKQKGGMANLMQPPSMPRFRGR